MLGPIQVFLDGQAVTLGAGMERALVALLAVHAGDSVSMSSIIEELWGEQAPASAREMVRTYVARTRKRLGDALHRQPDGYVLELAPDGLDAARFERLCAEGAEEISLGRRREGAEILRQALALWRSSPLPELDQLGSSREEIRRLEELRLVAIETRAEVDLSRENAAILVPELEGLVRANPYRERLRRAMMLALYHSGRQTEALECYLEGRRRLVEEVGIEPSRDLQELHQAILTQDPALDTPRTRTQTSPDTPTPPPAQAPAGPPGRPPQKRRRLVAFIAVGGAAVIAIALLIASGGSTPPPQIRRETLAALDPVNGKPVAARAITGVPGPIAVGARAVWVGDGQNRSVVAVDPDTLRTDALTRLGVFPYQIATDGSHAWIGNGFYGTITTLDSRGAKTGIFRPETRATGRLALAFGAGALWVGSQDGTLTEVAPSTNRRRAVIHGIGDAQALAVGAGSVWVAEANANEVRRVSVATHRVIRTIPIGGAPDGIAVGHGSIWAITSADGHVWRIDPGTGAVVAAISVLPESSLIVATDSGVWTGSSTATLQEIDPSQNAVIRTLQFPGPIGGLSNGHGRLWISVR